MKKFGIILLGFFIFAGTLFAQSRLNAGARQLEPEVAAQQLAEFKNFRMPGDFCLQFRIVHKPRNSDEERHFAGTLWGTWIDGAPRMRITLRRLLETGDTLVSPTQTSRRLLMIGGEKPELWEANEQGVPVKIDAKNTEPFFDGIVIAPFDLQTPFIYWKDFEYLRTERLRGRVSHFYKLFPPQDFKVAHPEIAAVQIAMDRTYNALVNVATLGGNDKMLKNFSLGSIKKVNEDYIFKTLDVRDERSRDKDTFEVKKAALRLALPADYFVPAALEKPDLQMPVGIFEKL